jgi:hypothetical protein
MIKIIGYILLLICCISFGLILVFPWFGFSARQIAGITTVLIITGEVTFYLGIIILGKSFYNKIKSLLMFWKRKPGDSGSPNEINPK